MNLWPDKLNEPHTPLFHAYKQSEALDDKYGLELRGEKSYVSPDIIIKFSIVSGADSRELMQIDNPGDYPCKLHFDGTISRCKTEAELIGKLAWVFNHAKTKQAIADLLK